MTVNPIPDFVAERLAWMRSHGIWPNGSRYLWTDAFGVVLLVSLYRHTGDRHWLHEAESVVNEVNAVLGRSRGLRIGEAPDRDGQYFHYLAMWMFALARLGDEIPGYRAAGVALARDVHAAFVVPGVGVYWKMEEDLGAPYDGYGMGALDAFDGYISYRLLDEAALAPEIAEMRALMDQVWPTLEIPQDLGLGMMLWLAHFFPDEPWAKAQREKSLTALDGMWVDPPGYFCRAPGATRTKFAFTNYGVSIGLQAQDAMPERVAAVHRFFDSYRSGDEYEMDAITHVMACAAHFPGRLLRHDG